MSYYDEVKLSKSFSKLTNEVIKFYKDVYNDDENVHARAQELLKIIDKSGTDFVTKKDGPTKVQVDRLTKTITCQLKRIQSGITVDEFKKTQPEDPFVRIGPIDFELDQEEYLWFKDVCDKQNVSIQQWVENNISTTSLYFSPIVDKHWVTFSWGYNYNKTLHGENFLPNYPDFSVLKKLKSLSIHPVSKHLKVSFGNELEEFSVNGDEIEHLVLEGKNQLYELQMSYCYGLKSCDITEIRIDGLDVIDSSGSKNVILTCTETQYRFSNSIRKSRFKKNKLPAQSDDIDFYVDIYNWGDNGENGYSFLKWVIKHPECELATALKIYWKGQPLYFLNKTKNDVLDINLDVFKILKQIEKRVKQKKYKSGTIIFNLERYIKSEELELAKKGIPSEMFEAS